MFEILPCKCFQHEFESWWNKVVMLKFSIYGYETWDTCFSSQLWSPRVNRQNKMQKKRRKILSKIKNICDRGKSIERGVKYNWMPPVTKYYTSFESDLSPFLRGSVTRSGAKYSRCLSVTQALFIIHHCSSSLWEVSNLLVLRTHNLSRFSHRNWYMPINNAMMYCDPLSVRRQ